MPHRPDAPAVDRATTRRVTRAARPAASPSSLWALRPVAAACSLMLWCAAPAWAQTAAEEPAKPAADKVDKADPGTQKVVVTGLRRAIETSVNAKRNSDAIIEAISAEDIGKLPDASIAESLARLPGLTGQRGPDGRVNVISIRGLAPAFAGALLNGREVVSSGDSRAVEYDQFPSELVGSAVVYKTPDALLIGQGLSGTVDIRTLKPLDLRGRQMVVNLRGEMNSNGNLAPGVASPLGSRFSFSYIDQFADNKLGLAVGFARLDVATQVKQTELVEYGDYSPFGLPVTGNVPSLNKYDGGTKQGNALLPMFWTATSSTKRNTRDGLMVVLEAKPNDQLHSELDLYYSRFNTHEVGGKFLSSMFATWGGGVAPNLSNIGTTQLGQNTYVTSATADKMPVTTGNFDTRRKDSIAALGWNNEFKATPEWTLISDLSYSRDVRNERYAEAYAAPYDSAKQQWTYGSFSWNVPTDGGRQTWTPVTPGYLANPGIIKLGDQQGFDFVNDQDAYTGAIRTPRIQDEIKALRLSSKHELGGVFSTLVAGLNYTQRDKLVSKNEARLLMKKDANGNYIRDIPTAALQNPFDMSWAGIPQLIRYDVNKLAEIGTVSLQPLFSQKVDNDSSVHEKVTTAFAKLDIDDNWFGATIRGNVGLQVVHTDQHSEGWEYRGNNANPDINLLFKRSGGTSYDDYLPSLNLNADLKDGWITRLGLAKTLARPDINDLRAGTSTPTVVSDVSGPHAGEWTTAYSGNPALQPWRAISADLSLEKYFGKRSYVGLGAFRKNLLNYIYNGLTSRDNSAYPVPNPLPPGVVVQKYGPVVQPINGQGGYVKGLELAASLEAGLIDPMFDGFGVVTSISKLKSSIVDKNNGNISLNGLSGTSSSVTAYYEKDGFQARISQRYRSPFTATTRDIFLNNTTRQQAADRVVDLQLGYAFEEGDLKGLSLLFQVNNLTDTATYNRKSVGPNAPDPTVLLPNYTYRYGRQTLVGMNYKF